jgi:hypothetical protein
LDALIAGHALSVTQPFEHTRACIVNVHERFEDVQLKYSWHTHTVIESRCTCAMAVCACNNASTVRISIVNDSNRLPTNGNAAVEDCAFAILSLYRCWMTLSKSVHTMNVMFVLCIVCRGVLVDDVATDEY